MTSYNDGIGVPVTAGFLLGMMLLPALIKLAGLVLLLLGLGEFGGSADSEIADLGTLMIGLGALCWLFLFVPTVVLFCVWSYRANANARALGACEMRFTPGWTVGWFFIPFAHLWMPCRAIGEAWRASDPRFDTREDPGAWMDAKVGVLVPLWWACWVLSYLVGNAGSRLRYRGHDVAGAWVGLPGEVLEISAALLAILMIVLMRRRQERKAAMLWRASV